MRLSYKAGTLLPSVINFCFEQKFTVFLLVFIFLFKAVFAQQIIKTSDLSQLNSIAQYSFQTLVVCGNDGYIIRSGNDGGSWFQRPSGTTENLNAIDPYGFYIVGGGGIILKGENAGANWTEIQSGTNNELRSVSGYPVVAVGSEGTIVKLNEISNLFEVKTSGTSQTLNDIDFADQQNGYSVGDNGTLIKTTDGGETWSSITSGTSVKLNAITFVPFSSVGWIVGDDGFILFSSDGGDNWGPQSSGTSENLFSVSGAEFNSQDVLVAGANGTVLKSTNGGTTWAAQNSGLSTNLRSVSNASFDYIAGDYIAIVRSSDAGVTWTLINNNISDVDNEIDLRLSNFRLFQNYPNPFNPATTIKYSVATQSIVTLKVFDVLGNEVATLINEEKPAGIYEVNFNASEISSGIYFYKLQAGSLVETKKMILMK